MSAARRSRLRLGLTVAVLAEFAWAQTPPDFTARRQWIERAIAARDAGDHAGALEMFSQAGQIQMRPGLRMSIAQEQQALGHGRDACESASECMVEVQADLASPESPRVLQGCAALVASACAPLGRVRVVPTTPVPTGLRVEVQGRVVDIARGAATVFVEPGVVAVRATAGGRVVFTQEVPVQSGLTASVTVDLTPSAAPVARTVEVSPPSAVAVAAPGVPVGEHVATPHPAGETVPVVSESITSQWWFWTGLSAVVVGGTLAALAAGGVFDSLAPPVGGTAYTVEALSAR